MILQYYHTLSREENLFPFPFDQYHSTSVIIIQQNISSSLELIPTTTLFNAQATYYKMENINESFNQVNIILKSVESNMAAATQLGPSQSQCLPVIGEILSRLKRIVAVSQDHVQSESGYDSFSSQEDVSQISVTSSSVSLSAQIPSSLSQLKGDCFIDKIKAFIWSL